MTPDTMLPIASVTKPFTVASLGTLVRWGKLDWDKPVRDYLPDFRVKDLWGVSVEFLAGPDGKVDRLAIHAGSSLIAPRKK